MNGHPDLDAFRAFAKPAAQRYALRGVHYWEVWSEPNLNQFFSPPDPVAYVALLDAGYEGVKAGNPGAFLWAASE
ncbi:glycosyl hydrolase family 39 [Bradymonas sediminis]|uniref:Uncharacterized protein n=1 Tax=Bradymonas sediminis TaxID=1548548 RepID=A0A2Z4FM68_9DELT|nr:hypothetical protein DN745_12445 [Bradymonas sediminis]TDP75932.1 glycosyl hydrolase family 39 [Bradymonas sediminis]